MKNQNTMRLELYEYIKSKYSAEPEYLWLNFPDYAVFRHSDNNKWFALIADVEKSKLGISGKGRVDIINVKVSDPLLIDMLVDGKSFFRGYHMSKKSWLSVLLDGSADMKQIRRLIDESYTATK